MTAIPADAPKAPPSRRPNILFITTDQQRKDTLGCYGNPLIRTPHVDQLAREGLRFDRAYCESPICLPSRVTLITGKHSRHHGVTLHNSSMRSGERTIGELLRQAGYRTHFIGKPHFKSQQHRGTEESITDWRDGLYDGWNGPYAGFETVDFVLGHSNPLVGHYGQWVRKHHPDKCRLFIADHFRKAAITCGQGVMQNPVPEEVYSSTYVGMRTCEFLEGMKDSDRPFYCFASFPDPHWPIIPPSPYYEMYDGVEMPANTPAHGEADKDNYPRQFRAAAQGQRTGYDGGGHYMKNPADAAVIMRPYWGSVSLIDKNVGRILQRLDELGMRDNTIVVFTTDHGDYMGAHGMMAKGGFLWEELVNVPLIVRYPGVVRAGGTTRTLFSFVDMVPTLLGLAGVGAESLACGGLSQADVLRGAAPSVRRCLTIMHAGNQEAVPDQHAIVTEDWKLVYCAGDPNGELYHLKEDPRELNNLYNRPQAQAEQARLTRLLMDELILNRDREPLLQARTADDYGRHPMMYSVWKREFDMYAS